MQESDYLIVKGRVALGVEYNGANYSGWQRQSTADSVQSQIEKALATILRQNVTISCAGRTDAGVHATGQVVHVDLPVERPIKALTRGLNTLMPKDIAIVWAKPVSNDFHARFSAYARRYRYIIHNHPLRSGVFFNGLTHAYQPLDAGLMHKAAQCLLGEHDFTSFRAAHCQSKTAVRTISAISVNRTNDYIMIDVQASAFLHHMVRNIVGSLMVVGTQEKPETWIAELLALKDRSKAAQTAKPNGLYLVKVSYPEQFAIPETNLGPLFL